MNVLALTGALGSGQTQAVIAIAQACSRATPGRVVMISPWDRLCASLAQCCHPAIPVISADTALDGLGITDPHTVLVLDLDMVPSDTRERLVAVIREAGTHTLVTGSA